jgi:nucleoid-associated protein YgaU
MPNDAKLGMIVGVGLVIAIAVVFFRKDGPVSQPGLEASVNGASSTNPLTASASRQGRAVKAQTAIRNEPAVFEGQKHTVTEGDTLFSLAKRYYQDERRFVDIFKVNQDVLSSPESLTPGTVLVIPKMKD